MRRELSSVTHNNPDALHAKANIRRQADTMQVQDTLYRQFQAELGPDFLKMAGPAAALKYSGYEIVPFSAADVSGHIMRHGPTSLTIGSKFAMNQAETATVLQSAERKMIAGFRDSLVTKGAVERHAFSRTYAQPVGTDALVDLKGRPSDRIFRTCPRFRRCSCRRPRENGAGEARGDFRYQPADLCRRSLRADEEGGVLYRVPGKCRAAFLRHGILEDARLQGDARRGARDAGGDEGEHRYHRAGDRGPGGGPDDDRRGANDSWHGSSSRQSADGKPLCAD